MNGGPSQMDTVRLQAEAERATSTRTCPTRVRKGQRLTTMTSGQARFPVAPSKFKFAQHGKCGTWVSELLPHTAKIVDDIALRQVDAHRGDQPRPGHHLHHDRQPAARPAEPRLVAQLRPGQREQRPAGVRRHDAALAGRHRRPRRSSPRMWAQRLPAQQVPAASRSAAAATRCCTCPEPAGRRRRRPPRACSTRSASSTSGSSSSSATRRRRRASRSTRWPSACRPACRS